MKCELRWSAASSAPDFTVVRLVGIESEMRLGLAGLHQPLMPSLEGLESLPAPQARVLRAAFGTGDAVVPDQFRVGCSTERLRARESPWFDGPERSATLVRTDDRLARLTAPTG